jgi:hypothetical protein
MSGLARPGRGSAADQFPDPPRRCRSAAGIGTQDRGGKVTRPEHGGVGDLHINEQIPTKPYFTKNVQNGV